jgi:formylglycine-generating enzyme required for sulfatase activity
MVRVNAGESVMGDWRNEGQADERPPHVVQLSAFLIDTYEVTNQQFADALNWAMSHDKISVSFTGVSYPAQQGPYAIHLCDTTAQTSYSSITWDGSSFGVISGDEYHPVVQVSWHGAASYCNWLSAIEGREQCCEDTVEYSFDPLCNLRRSGYRLPTEAEWEKAAGWDPVELRAFRFGEHSDGCGVNCLNGARANYAKSGDPFDTAPFPQTTPVGFYPVAFSPYGAYDMSGNVWEWCYDRYSSTYYAASPAADPSGPTTGGERVERGGSWFNDPISLRTTMRNHFQSTMGNPNVGFRCAMTVTPDLDGNGDADTADLAPFALCLSGPGNTTAPAGCGPYDQVRADWDGDQDVDLHDAAIYMRELGAALNP